MVLEWVGLQCLTLLVQMRRRYVLTRERTLPQLEWDTERQRVPAPVLMDRLSSALAASTWAAVALQSWQSHGGRHPLRLPRASHIWRPSRVQLLRRRHDRLATMHRALVKVSGGAGLGCKVPAAMTRFGHGLQNISAIHFYGKGHASSAVNEIEAVLLSNS